MLEVLLSKRKFHLAALFVGIFLFFSGITERPKNGMALAQQESGTWKCIQRDGGSCPPSGDGRGAEDWWTYPHLHRKISVVCTIRDGEFFAEKCVGAYWVIRDVVGGVIAWQPSFTGVFGASLYCPSGSVGIGGTCVNPDNMPSDQACPLSLGNPVDVLTGRKHEHFVDWSSGGSHPLALERFYSSYRAVISAPRDSSLGNGWRTNFDAAASWNAGSPTDATLVHIVLPAFFQYSFLKQSGVWKLVLPRLSRSSVVYDRVRADLDVALTVTPSGVVLRMQDGRRYSFGASGQLTQISFGGGYAQSLVYSGGRLVRVVDNLGRWLEMTYGGTNIPNLLTQVKSSDGDRILYRYVSRFVINNPEQAAKTVHDGYWTLKSVIYSDDTPSSMSDNPRQTFTYLDDLGNPFLLSAISDERGVRFAEWTYDSKGRATSSQHAGGVDRWEFAYDDAAETVTVTNPLGRQTVFAYRRVNGAIRQLIAVKGIASTNCAQSDTIYSYDVNGFRSMATDAEGRVTRWQRVSGGPTRATTLHPM